MQVGFIGTGHMGNPMALNLIRAGHRLVVHDLRPEAAANLLEAGAVWAVSPHFVASQVDVLFTSLPGPAEMEHVLTGPNGILAGARPGLTYFDLTTNSPTVIRRLAAIAAERGVTLLDAPVSGGAEGARAGTLSVMVAGDRATYEAYRDLLQAIGRNTFYLGDLGSGCALKMVNNLIVFAVQQIVQEGTVLGVKAGLDPATLFEVMRVSSAGPYVGRLPEYLDRAYEDAWFTVELAAKDVGLSVQAARDLGLGLSIAPVVEQNFLRARGRGLGKQNPYAVLRVFEDAAGVEVPPLERGAPEQT
ncbi:MAG TPA: NAD(P)-dependent oxidoreductase [Dehalococcoidia bacterium]|nr:NAD(P)-dependent oxidoreductase [Dehalococcoidia bacterium]